MQTDSCQSIQSVHVRAHARTAVVRFLAVRTGWRSRTAVWARTFTTKSRPTQAASACSSASPVRPVASAGAEPEELVWVRCVAAPVVRGTGQARTDAQQPTHRCMRMRMAVVQSKPGLGPPTHLTHAQPAFALLGPMDSRRRCGCTQATSLSALSNLRMSLRCMSLPRRCVRALECP